MIYMFTMENTEGFDQKTLDKMNARLQGNEIVGIIDFNEPLRSRKEVSFERVKTWVGEILNRIQN